jgi:ABC-2 type transport system permease protein
MAYFMVAAIMAAIGSAVSDLQEAHALITPAMLVLFLPMVLFMPVSQSPNGVLAVVTSYIPVLTPFVMIIRVTSAEAIPMWQVISATAFGFFGVLLMVWMAARIFRVGVLMTGKPPSPMELIKWLRYS